MIPEEIMMKRSRKGQRKSKRMVVAGGGGVSFAMAHTGLLDRLISTEGGFKSFCEFSGL